MTIVNGGVAAVADGVALRTGKFTAKALIPVVGECFLMPLNRCRGRPHSQEFHWPLWGNCSVGNLHLPCIAVICNYPHLPGDCCAASAFGRGSRQRDLGNNGQIYVRRHWGCGGSGGYVFHNHYHNYRCSKLYAHVGVKMVDVILQLVRRLVLVAIFAGFSELLLPSGKFRGLSGLQWVWLSCLMLQPLALLRGLVFRCGRTTESSGEWGRSAEQ